MGGEDDGDEVLVLSGVATQEGAQDLTGGCVGGEDGGDEVLVLSGVATQEGAQALISRKAVLKMRMQGWSKSFQSENGRVPTPADKEASAKYMRYRRELKKIEAAIGLARELKATDGKRRFSSTMAEVVFAVTAQANAASPAGAPEAATKKPAMKDMLMSASGATETAPLNPNTAGLAALDAAPRKKKGGCCVVS